MKQVGRVNPQRENTKQRRFSEAQSRFRTAVYLEDREI